VTPRRKQVLFLLLLIGWFSLLHIQALATKFEVYGGPGGEGFSASCPPGYHMVGLEGRTGKWIDKMAPICGSWIPERQGFVNRIVIGSVGTSE
jgi:hypothetical protein